MYSVYRFTEISKQHEKLLFKVNSKKASTAKAIEDLKLIVGNLAKFLSLRSPFEEVSDLDTNCTDTK